jgi:ubiquitin carboxyl-terminal hydrolase 10
LQYISYPHSVEITSPTRPGHVIEASRQELIEALPPVLILHLKRFLYDTKVGDVVKIGKQVAFGPELEITPGEYYPAVSAHPCNILADLIAPTRRPAHPVKYQLFGG